MTVVKKPTAAKTILKSKPVKVAAKADIFKKISKVREEAETLKRNMHMGDVQNVRAYKLKRRELARVLTAFNNFKAEEK
jgi:ribosomal protein L29